MEGYFEQVVEALTGALYRWYETANFCRRRSRGRTGPSRPAQPRVLAGRDYVGIGIGAVSTVGGRRWRNAPSLGATWPRSDAASGHRASTRRSATT